MEGHAHGKDIGTDSTVIRNLIADAGECGGIHDRPDVGFDSPYLDVGFIGGKGRAFFVGVLIYKGLHTDRGCFGVVSDLWMRDMNAI